MELHVLHILDLGSGERGHADAVTGRAVGVRRPRVEVADAAGRQHDAAGEVRVDLAVGFEHRAVDPPLVTDEFERGGVVQNLHAVVVVDVVQERDVTCAPVEASTWRMRLRCGRPRG